MLYTSDSVKIVSAGNIPLQHQCEYDRLSFAISVEISFVIKPTKLDS